MCNVETYVGKTWQKLQGQSNNHISKSGSGKGNNKFDGHVYSCGVKNKCLKPPYFKIYVFMACQIEKSYLHMRSTLNAMDSIC